MSLIGRISRKLEWKIISGLIVTMMGMCIVDLVEEKGARVSIEERADTEDYERVRGGDKGV